jgi:hypothetical protein
MNRRSFLALVGSALAVKAKAVAAPKPAILHPGDIVPFSVTGRSDLWIPYTICDELRLQAGQIVDEILFPPPQPQDFMVTALSMLPSAHPSGLLIEVRMGEYLMIKRVPLEVLSAIAPMQLLPAWTFSEKHPMSVRLSGTAISEMQIAFALHGSLKATAEWAASVEEEDDEEDEEDEEDAADFHEDYNDWDDYDWDDFDEDEED